MQGSLSCLWAKRTPPPRPPFLVLSFSPNIFGTQFVFSPTKKGKSGLDWTRSIISFLSSSFHQEYYTCWRGREPTFFLPLCNTSKKDRRAGKRGELFFFLHPPLPPNKKNKEKRVCQQTHTGKTGGMEVTRAEIGTPPQKVCFPTLKAEALCN